MAKLCKKAKGKTAKRKIATRSGAKRKIATRSGGSKICKKRNCTTNAQNKVVCQGFCYKHARQAGLTTGTFCQQEGCANYSRGHAWMGELRWKYCRRHATYKLSIAGASAIADGANDKEPDGGCEIGTGGEKSDDDSGLRVVYNVVESGGISKGIDAATLCRTKCSLRKLMRRW